tara:strand:+ start:104 stop:520 length:417 start_codon:yes stop_codon:yes gene_type:complete
VVVDSVLSTVAPQAVVAVAVAVAVDTVDIGRASPCYLIQADQVKEEQMRSLQVDLDALEVFPGNVVVVVAAADGVDVDFDLLDYWMVGQAEDLICEAFSLAAETLVLRPHHSQSSFASLLSPSSPATRLLPSPSSARP